jgi:hypothetical protein
VTVANDDFHQWLEALGLGQYAPAFSDNDVGFDALRLLSDTDLKELGVSLGHRRILQGAVQQLQPGRAAGAASTAPPPGSRRKTSDHGDVLRPGRLVRVVGAVRSGRPAQPHPRLLLVVCRIIEESGGFIARIIGDGILAYFGYPAAREDAAECAIRAGLHIVESMAREHPEGDGRIDVRIGLATGVSVISEMVGIGFSELHAVMGQTPNVAARIQSLAEPGTVAIADETRRLAGGFFVYADQGAHPVKGFSEPMQVWRVVSESRSGARFDAQHSAQVDCIGRDAQLGALQEAWDRVQQRSCRIVTLVGEAGIGKSRLLRTASERFGPAPGLIVFMQCAPSQATTPLHPLIDWLRRDIGVTPAGAPRTVPVSRPGWAPTRRRWRWR